MHTSEGKELIWNMYLTNRRSQKKDTNRKQIYRISEIAEINMWKPDSKHGSEERNSHLGINRAADKKKWK
jgi:hypothetical protein